MSFHGLLGAHKAGPLLVEGDCVRPRGVGGEAAPELTHVEKLVWQVVFVRASHAARDEIPILAPDHEPPRERHELLPRLPLQLFPELVGAQQQRDVLRPLEVRLADDAGASVAGAPVMRRGEPFESEDLFAATGELVGGGAPHAAQAGDDDVVGQIPPLSTSGSV
jgi:hypothetical protein